MLADDPAVATPLGRDRPASLTDPANDLAAAGAITDRLRATTAHP